MAGFYQPVNKKGQAHNDTVGSGHLVSDPILTARQLHKVSSGHSRRQSVIHWILTARQLHKVSQGHNRRQSIIHWILTACQLHRVSSGHSREQSVIHWILTAC